MKKYLVCCLLWISMVACERTNLIVIEGWQPLTIDDCLSFVEEQYIINDTAAYHNLRYHGFEDTTACVGYMLPPIDFSRKTLLGYHTSVDGCDVFYERELLANPKNKSYIYSIKVTADQSCATATVVEHYNWIVVPKIPEAYAVNFEVDYHQ